MTGIVNMHFCLVYLLALQNSYTMAARVLLIYTPKVHELQALLILYTSDD